MKVYLKKGFVFTPEWNGNKKLPKEEQIRIHFQFLSGVDFEELMYDSTEGIKGIDPKKEFLKTVEKIENLEIDGRDAKPEDLINEPTLFALYVEAKLGYRSETSLGEEPKKK